MPGYSIPTDKEIAEKARRLIISDLAVAYSLSSLAGQCSVTPYTLKRIFKKIYGLSIASFYLQVRMDQAKDLLTKTNNTLQMIAEAVGYTESTNFQNIFKRTVGMTPGEYRKNNQNSAV